MPKSPLSVEVISQVILSLVFIVILIIVAALVYRKAGRYSKNSMNNLGVITGFSIGSKERIVLIRAGNEQILVGVGPGVIQRIHVLEEPLASIVNNETTSQSFVDKLKKELGKIGA